MTSQSCLTPQSTWAQHQEHTRRKIVSCAWNWLPNLYVPGQRHCIAAADNEVLSSSHQGRYTTRPLCTESRFWQGVLCFVDFLLCCSFYSKIPLNVVGCFVSGKRILKTSIETLAMTITVEMMTLFHQKGCPNVEGWRVVPRCLQEMHYFYLILNKRSWPWSQHVKPKSVMWETWQALGHQTLQSWCLHTLVPSPTQQTAWAQCR